MSKVKFKSFSINTYFLVFMIIIIVSILTWVVPAGEYQYMENGGKKVVDPHSFRLVDKNPQGLLAILMAPVRGFGDGSVALIVGFVLIIGGVFSVLQKTGAIEALIRAAAIRVKSKPFLERAFIPLFMFLFAFAGATFGMSEEVIPFVLLFIPLAISLGYDTLVGVAIPFIGAGAGFAGAFMNPFTVGIAQQIAELKIFSGFLYRLVCWFVVTFVAVLFVVFYAKKVKSNPRLSITYEIDLQKREKLHLEEDLNQCRLSFQHKAVGLILIIGLAVMIFGVLRYGWYVDRITAVFLGMGIAGAIAGRLKIDQFTTAFIEGARDLVGTALIIVMARGILYIAQDGRIIDTFLHASTGLIQGVHSYFAAVIMFVIQSFINFFIPSGSAKAALTMPLMVPLADLCGLSRQVAVLAYQFGDGFSNMIVPTSAVTMTVLMSAGIPFEKWFKLIWKLQLWFFLTGLLLLLPPVLTGW